MNRLSIFRLPTHLVAALLLMGGSYAVAAPPLYSNSGDNTTGFVDKFSTGHFLTDGTYLVEATGGTWATIPLQVTGNFKMSFQVYNSSYDGDSHILLLDPGTSAGVDIRNSPEDTDTPSLNVFSGTNFTNYSQFFFPTPANTVATAEASSFPSMAWTMVTISLSNGILTDQVGSQVLTANLTSLKLPATLQLALGGYATTYNPNSNIYPDRTGELLYRQITVTPTPEPSTISLLLAALAIFLIQNPVRRAWQMVER